MRYMLCLFCTLNFFCAAGQSPLLGKRICIDPGHGGTAKTDQYRVGVNGEREEWINLRVAMFLRKALEKKGATVFMTRSSDEAIALEDRARMAVDNKADVFFSIHHNATADRNVNFPIIYYHGAASENASGVELAKHLAAAFVKIQYKRKTAVSIVSDHTVFPRQGASVLRNTYGIPGVLAEASFFSNVAEEKKLKRKRYNRSEARAYLQALESYFAAPRAPITEKQIPYRLSPFMVLEEAQRMDPQALTWLQDFKEAEQRMRTPDSSAMVTAYDLFTRSARSFPDSYVAQQCHEYRAEILKTLQRDEEAAQEKRRAAEYYVKFKL